MWGYFSIRRIIRLKNKKNKTDFYQLLPPNPKVQNFLRFLIIFIFLKPPGYGTIQLIFLKKKIIDISGPTDIHKYIFHYNIYYLNVE